MDQKHRRELLQAARTDGLLSLELLLHEDPKLLDKSDLLITPEDTPIHVATLSGNTKFAREVLRRTPCLAWNQNQAGLSPLHIASALGHLEIAKALLELGTELCLLRDQKGLTPLHHAAAKGKVHIIEELLAKCRQVLFTVTSQQDSALHLAVRHRQVGALRVLLRSLTDSRKKNRMINIARNRHGFTVSQLAESTGQVEALALLKWRDGTPNTEQEAVEIVNVDLDVQPNISGTDDTMSVRTQTRKEEKDEQQQQPEGKAYVRALTIPFFFVRMLRFLGFEEFGFEESALQVVAVLLLQMTYHALLAPPSPIWKEDMKLDYKCFKYAFSKNINLHSPLSCPTRKFICFMALNAVGFLSALTLLLKYKSGPRTQFLLIASFYALLGSYLILLGAVIPDYLAFLVICGCAIIIIGLFAVPYWTWRKTIWKTAK